MLEAVSVFPGNDIFFETMKKFHEKSGVCRHFSTNQVSGHHSSLLLVGSSIFSPQKMAARISQMARPGVAPVEYTDGARVEMKVNKPSSQLSAPSSSQILFVFMRYARYAWTAWTAWTDGMCFLNAILTTC